MTSSAPWAVDAGELRAAQLLWATVDSPWVHSVSTASYLSSVRSLESLSARTLLSSHLPPAVGIQSQLLDMLAAAPAADAFTGPTSRR